MEESMRGSVLIIGSGIAGMQSALSLTEQGFKVYLLESKPTIGGRMAQLDKMYPTGECAMCTQLPKMLEITTNPNIQLMTFCEVVGLEGNPGDFRVTVLKKPRYVDPVKCNACMECFPVCPVGGVPMEFNFGRGASKAITFYSPFPPRKAIIYPDACTYIKEGKCGEGEKPPCVVACKPEAIDFSQEPREVQLNVGAIVVATGVDVYRSPELSRLGYGRHANVLTNIEFERLLSGIGPTAGMVQRADGTVPKRVAWIQCVGSKESRRGENYCSAVCCMAATSEALGVLERRKDSEVFIVHDDIIGYAKRFQEYYRKAQEEGVSYIRAKVSGVSQGDDGGLRLSLRKPTGEPYELAVDMLVLSTAVTPNPDNETLAQILDIELDENGFFREKEVFGGQVASTREGVFLCGATQSPKDISESVVQSLAASASAAALLSEARQTELADATPPGEIEVKTTDEPRIGVLICRCGKNIAGVINVDKLAEYAQSLPNVVTVVVDEFGCAGAALKQMIVENRLNRVVLGACSPKTHEHLFSLHCESVGLNRYLMEIVNLRNQCTWVHQKEPEAAAQKAETLVRMGVTRAAMLEPLHPIQTEVVQECLVLGGGISGMACASRLGDMGYDVHLVEKSGRLGGVLNELHRLSNNGPLAADVIERFRKMLESSDRVTVHLNAEVQEVEGYIGQFRARLHESGEEREVAAGAVVVATGAREMKPHGLFGYDGKEAIITQLELEKRLKTGQLVLRDNANVVMISCVGTKEKGNGDQRTYCCRVGCPTMIKNAGVLRELKPDATVSILHRDMPLPYKRGEQQRSSLEQRGGVEFIRYSRDKKPRVSDDLRVAVWDCDAEAEKEIEADLVVLTSPLEPPEENARIKEMLNLQLDPSGFFAEAIGKLNPLDFVASGVFLCGTAHSPKGVAEAIADGEGVAARVASIISSPVMTKEPAVSFVVDEKCDGCAYCIDPCPFHALALIEYMRDEAIKKTVDANEAVCKGCGTCMATCPKQGIYIRHHRPEQFMAMIKSALEETQ
jgi:heterodisulfide reductase subunit A2